MGGPTLFPSVNPTGSPTTDPSWEPTLEPTVYPTVIPTLVPTTEPTWNITLRRRLLSDDANVYDLIVVFEADIESMAVDGTQDGNVDILSPTYMPTSHPTYDYEEGETYGQWMVGIGFVLAVAFFAYWSYSKYKRYKYEKKEKRKDKDKEGNGVEFHA